MAENVESRLLKPYIRSHINALKESVILGIDEAGRGSVLGPMVYACFYCRTDDEKILRELKIDDSKKLTEGQREHAFLGITERKDRFGWRIHGIMPQEISSKMLRKHKISLNAISHDAAIDLIRQTIRNGVNISHVYVDTVGNAESYEEKLSSLFPNLTITVSEKADSKFPVVSAASILAKVTRDRLLKEMTPYHPETYQDDSSELYRIEKNATTRQADTNGYANNYGSGYPGDPVTKDYLQKSLHSVLGYPTIVRFSWSTAKDLFESQGTIIDWYDQDNNEKNTELEDNGKAQKITHFFQRKLNSEKVVPMPSFFLKNNIDLITNLESLK